MVESIQNILHHCLDVIKSINLKAFIPKHKPQIKKPKAKTLKDQLQSINPKA